MRMLKFLAVIMTAAVIMLCGIPAYAAEAQVRGDCNGDGTIDLSDVTALQQFLTVRSSKLTIGADMDGNGHINAIDLSLLKRELLKKEEKAVLLVYLCGADLESVNKEATADFLEMQNASYTDNLTVVVQTGGTETWHTDGLTDGGNDRIIFSKDGMEIRNGTGNVCYMNQIATLYDFITETTAEFPADHYGLVFWGHGTGSVFGVCYDPFSGQPMTLPNLHYALQEASVRFDWIGFDSCLMATAETAYAVHEYADYMIASTESISSYGWDYTAFLTLWAENPGMEPKALADCITDEMIAVNKENELPATISCFDLRQSETLMQALYRYTDEVYIAFQQDGIEPILNARGSGVDFGQEVYDMTDLKSLVSVLQNEQSDAVLTELDKMVIFNKSYQLDYSSGMAIWFFERHPEDGITLISRMFTPIGIDETYISQLVEMSKAAYAAAKSD
ncbi:MAG: hypothetical protein K6E36_05460 [Oscillospiraceae bacterium]|nr:hypothetical protein [Oscillospiraceae bacterium]